MDLANFILKLKQKKQSDCEKLYINIVKKYDKINNIDIVKYNKLYQLDHDEKNSVKKYILTNLTEENKTDIVELYDEINNLKKCDKALSYIIFNKECMNVSNHFKMYVDINEPLYDNINESLYDKINCIFEIKTDVLKRISKIKNINENKKQFKFIMK